MGEGYHNYHHEFPTDYRNGVALTAWDPTKVLRYPLIADFNLSAVVYCNSRVFRIGQWS